MKKEVEIINFENNPGKKLYGEQLTKQVSPFFTIYTIVSEEDNFNIETVNSVLNQTYQKFEWIIFSNNKVKNKIQNILNEYNIFDKRISLKPYKQNFLKEINSDYLIPLDFETYLDRTLLETFYSYISYYGEIGVIYTNCISKTNKLAFNKSLISIRKRLINFSTRSFCYNKKHYDYINLENDNTYSLPCNCKIIHFNYYGVWHETTKENIIKLKQGSYKNYPSSSNYNYDTIPDNKIIKIGEVKKGKNLLCMVPWHKIGGADLFNYNMFKYLKTKGYNIYVVSTEVCNYEARFLLENVVDGFYDLTTFIDRKEWANYIKSIIVNKNIDLVLQLSSLYGYYLIPWLKCQFPELPIIDYIHVENFAWRNGGFPRDSVNIANFLDKTYCCNKHLEELLYNQMNRKINNTQTMYIGVDTDKYNPDIVEITDKETLEFCKNKKVILYPCRFCFEKRPLFLLNVMKNLIKKRDDIVCLMVGDGEAKSSIENYIKNNKLAKYVKIIPLKSDIRQYYKIADITLICSLFEGITLTTYESLSMNTPVISSDVGGEKEVINEKVGSIIKTFQKSEELMDFNYTEKELKLYEDSIIKILNNSKKYTENNNCRKYMIDNFSINHIYENFEKEISSFLKNGSSISKNVLNNDNFAIQYLVMFNETTRTFYNNSLDYENFKNAMRDKVYRNNLLWQHWWWRYSVKVAKKLKIDRIIKKLFFNN